MNVERSTVGTKKSVGVNVQSRLISSTHDSPSRSLRAHFTSIHCHTFLRAFFYLSYFNLAVPKRKCSGKHFCMSSTFSIAILNGTCSLRSPWDRLCFGWKKNIYYNNNNVLLRIKYFDEVCRKMALNPHTLIRIC